MGNAKFIAFEGLDGSGKTTLIAGLTAFLEARGTACVTTREPGGTQLGDAIRALLLDRNGDIPCGRAEILMYEAGRAQHVEHVIRPALADQKWVLCDRFVASSLAFQGAASGVARKDVEWLNQFAVHGVWPDLTVFLDLDPHTARHRQLRRSTKEGTSPDRLESEHENFHQRVGDGYRALANESQTSDHPWLVLDAGAPPRNLLAELCRRLQEINWLD